VQRSVVWYWWDDDDIFDLYI